MDESVRVHADNIRVICGMVDLAETKTVGYLWQSLRMSIGKDVRGIQQWNVSKAADRALLPVGCQNEATKSRPSPATAVWMKRKKSS